MSVNNLKLLSQFFLLFFFVSCQKEINPGNGTSPTTNTDSIYLDKIYVLDNSGNRIDSISFVYDNMKRVVSMGFNNPYPDMDLYNYYYNGTDTLPFRSRHINLRSGSLDTTITYHVYDMNNRNLEDSALVSRRNTGPFGIFTYSVEVAHYSYGAGKKYTYSDITTSLPAPASFFIRTDTALVDANGNISSSKANFSTTSLYNTSSLTYDSHINPFSILSNFKAHQNFPSGETLFFEYFPFNNILTLNETNQGSPANTTNYTYTYRSNGLPGTATVVFNSIDTTRLLYTYQKL